MCGICGFVSRDGHKTGYARQVVHAMCGTIVHRGPDDEGVHVDADAAIGMRRLSIIDVEGGHQPIYNEAETICVVLNGEIYNFRELRAELERKGHRFTTRSDTEVIVHLYEEYGNECVRRLNGMFAFAVWDTERRCLLLARDRLGVKPLYYWVGNNKLAFASELKALLAVPHVPRTVDLTALDDYLCYLYVPGPRSILSSIQKLQPAHFLTYSRDSSAPETTRYWDLEFDPDLNMSEDRALDEFRDLFSKAVRDRLVCDVPFGAFLSGGLDSSSVVALMSRELSQPVRTFSVGWPGLDGNETEYAAAVARRFGTTHSEIVLETPDLRELLETLAQYLDEPFGDPSTAPTYLMSQAARQEVKMVLSGDGGDELLAGYSGFLYNVWADRAAKLPAVVRRLVAAIARAGLGGEKVVRFLDQAQRPLAERWAWSRAVLKSDARLELYTPELLAALDGHRPGEFLRETLKNTRGPDTVSRLQEVLIRHYLPDDVLTKVDRASMACSLEVRSPLLDYRLFELSVRLPSHLKLRGKQTKYLLRRAVEGILPEHIVARAKQGFTPPTGQWFRSQLAGYAREVLLSSRCLERGYFRHDALKRLVEEHISGQKDHGDLLWALVMLELWCREYASGRARACVEA